MACVITKDELNNKSISNKREGLPMLWTLEEERLEDDYQASLIQHLLANKPHWKLMHMEEWTVPIITYRVDVTSATKSRLDILKKMVMTLAKSKLKIKPADMHQFLHVDDLFVQDVVQQMLNVHVLKETTIGELSLTPLGEEQLAAGTVLSSPILESFYFHHDSLQGGLLPEDPNNPWLKEHWDLPPYRYQTEELNLDNKILDSVGLREFLSDTKQQFEVGGKEKIISSIEPLTQSDRSSAKMVEYHLYDMLNDELFCKVWNGATSQWDIELEENIMMHEKEQWREQHTSELTPYLTKRYEQLKQGFKILEQQKTLHSKNTDLSILRGIEIRRMFLNSFSDTKHKMLMISPWISEQVMDYEMFELLQNFASAGKTLYIAWGIAKHPQAEGRAPATELLDRLRAIRHADGTQAVFVRWFGNQHNKEIVIDQSKLLLGSFNWLSYRGDYNLRNESVIMTPDATAIAETTQHIEEKFIEALEKELSTLLPSELYGTDSLFEFDRAATLDWMKELIVLDSAFEKRKQLSDRLYRAVRDHGSSTLAHELALLWLTYQKEDFGAIHYLAYLLQHQETQRAYAYYKHALRLVPHSTIWQTHDDLSPYQEWFDSFEISELTSTVASKKTRTRKRKK